MIARARQRDRGAGWAFILSLAFHIMTILVCKNTDLFRSPLSESTPYYVDIISLPSPDPAPAAGAPAPSTPSAQPAAVQKPAITLPVKQLSPPPPATSSPSAEQERRNQEAREFSERMNRIERGSDARHQADALASLQKRVAEKKGAGRSSATGIDIGADYGAYIQSRLKDALSRTIVFRSQNPEAAVHIYIDRNGKLVKHVMVRPSADKLFNNSVIRTIEKAQADFPPVPSGAGFDKLYVFSPQEVKK